MTKRTTVGWMVVLAGVLLTTAASVYADHAATGKGTFAVDPLALAEFHFVVAKPAATPSPDSDLNFVNFVQSEMTGRAGSTVFQTFMISTAIAPLDITTTSAGRTVTIQGQMVSTTFLGVGEARRQFAELVSFTAKGVDARVPEPGADSFSLEVTYSADADDIQGQLFKSLKLGVCDDKTKTCTITFEGPVKRGDIFVHTTGGD